MPLPHRITISLLRRHLMDAAMMGGRKESAGEGDRTGEREGEVEGEQTDPGTYRSVDDRGNYHQR